MGTPFQIPPTLSPRPADRAARDVCGGHRAQGQAPAVQGQRRLPHRLLLLDSSGWHRGPRLSPRGARHRPRHSVGNQRPQPMASEQRTVSWLAFCGASDGSRERDPRPSKHVRRTQRHPRSQLLALPRWRRSRAGGRDRGAALDDASITWSVSPSLPRLAPGCRGGLPPPPCHGRFPRLRSSGRRRLYPPFHHHQRGWWHGDTLPAAGVVWCAS
mmetsp:Transcript_37970/g.88769  ORF Transcript_37970/g.88769 Transcript_37970/m.88769 type:complete len:214 (+) Transcript_37970:291-932(+)